MLKPEYTGIIASLLLMLWFLVLPGNQQLCHYNDVIMCAITSQITSLAIVYSTVYSRPRSKKTSKLRVTGLCEGNSPVTGEFPAQRASNAENVSIWWRHHVTMVLSMRDKKVSTMWDTRALDLHKEKFQAWYCRSFMDFPHKKTMTWETFGQRCDTIRYMHFVPQHEHTRKSVHWLIEVGTKYPTLCMRLFHFSNANYYFLIKNLQKWFSLSPIDNTSALVQVTACGYYSSQGRNHEGVMTWTRFAHDDVIKWNHFPRYWPFVRRIHRYPVNSPHKGQWRGTLMFSLICARINDWVNNREAGDLRRRWAHYDITVMAVRGSSGLPKWKWHEASISIWC